jgi:hypothetical protein
MPISSDVQAIDFLFLMGCNLLEANLKAKYVG